MKRFLIVMGLIVIGVAVLGFYRGWFRFGSDGVDGRSNISLSVDGDKFEKDRKAIVAGVQNLGGKTDNKVAGKSHDGKVVSATGGKLVMTNMEGGDEHLQALTADVQITCDGKQCKAEDLKAGMRIRVTTEAAAPHAAIRIEALDNQQDFDKGV